MPWAGSTKENPAAPPSSFAPSVGSGAAVGAPQGTIRVWVAGRREVPYRPGGRLGQPPVDGNSAW